MYGTSKLMFPRVLMAGLTCHELAKAPNLDVFILDLGIVPVAFGLEGVKLSVWVSPRGIGCCNQHLYTANVPYPVGLAAARKAWTYSTIPYGMRETFFCHVQANDE